MWELLFNGKKPVAFFHLIVPNIYCRFGLIGYYLKFRKISSVEIFVLTCFTVRFCQQTSILSKSIFTYLYLYTFLLQQGVGWTVALPRVCKPSPRPGGDSQPAGGGGGGRGPGGPARGAQCKYLHHIFYANISSVLGIRIRGSVPQTNESGSDSFLL
jgi:hypothetical protein